MDFKVKIGVDNSTVNISWSELVNVRMYTVSVFLKDGLFCYFENLYNKYNVVLKEISQDIYYCEVKAFCESGKTYEANSEYFKTSLGMNSNLDNEIRLLIKDPTFSGVKNLIETRSTSLKYAFLKFRSVFYSRGIITNKEKLLNIVSIIINNGVNLPSQSLFLLSILVYGHSKTWLSNESADLIKIIYDSGIPEHEIFFLIGLLNYKIGNYKKAEIEFSKILPSKDLLMSHQWSALNYKYLYNKTSSYEDKLRDFYLIKEAKMKDEGIILVSCDWGYYKAYHHMIDSKIDQLGLNIHYHIVLPEGFPLEDINCVTKTIGVSYEIEPLETRSLDKNYKTYYSLVRYLVAKKISLLYDQKVLIADIDIDFRSNISTVFKNVNNNEAALVFSRSDLPWTKIMAGFNVFGKDFFNSDFYLILCNFIIDNLNWGLNFWMLDQVALDVAYVNSTRDTVSLVKSMNNIIDFKIIQHENNSNLKYLAKKNIIDKIKEIKLKK